MGSAESHQIDVRDKPAFLRSLMGALAGRAAISLEGDLTKCQFADELVIAREETGTLRRGTLSPRQDFVVLRLEHETVAPIFKQVMAAGVKHRIIHIQIERDGVVELGAYDNFHPHCVATGPGVPESLLANLQAERIVRSFSARAAPGC